MKCLNSREGSRQYEGSERRFKRKKEQRGGGAKAKRQGNEKNNSAPKMNESYGGGKRSRDGGEGGRKETNRKKLGGIINSFITGKVSESWVWSKTVANTVLRGKKKGANYKKIH